MLKIDRSAQTFTRLDLPTMRELKLLERQHLQEFICNSPDAFFAELGQKLFLIGSEVVPSETVPDRIDLLAVDREGKVVVIELKRGSHKLQLLQAIGYAAMMGQWDSSDILNLCDAERREGLLDFVEVDEQEIGRSQRIILVAEDFEYEVLVAAEWLAERHGVDIQCCRIGLSKDPKSREEFLVCSTIYPAPELASHARIRSARRTPGSPQRWGSWEEALASIENAAVVSFFEDVLAGGGEDYLPKRILRFRLHGKRRWAISARRKLAYGWQSGRFEGDVKFWREGLGDPDEVRPVKREQSLRFYLKTSEDFRFFGTAIESTLAGVEWREPGTIEDEDPETGG